MGPFSRYDSPIAKANPGEKIQENWSFCQVMSAPTTAKALNVPSSARAIVVVATAVERKVGRWGNVGKGVFS